jgi:hypothetical protein
VGGSRRSPTAPEHELLASGATYDRAALAASDASLAALLA